MPKILTSLTWCPQHGATSHLQPQPGDKTLWDDDAGDDAFDDDDGAADIDDADYADVADAI